MSVKKKGERRMRLDKGRCNHLSRDRSKDVVIPSGGLRKITSYNFKQVIFIRVCICLAEPSRKHRGFAGGGGGFIYTILRFGNERWHMLLGLGIATPAVRARNGSA